ncbi:MAG: transcriptional regulator [Ferroplasma sp. Type II]|uniref:PadR family transcriptional regulator n=1 Tax=Ferroplasma sp. Type II TaxID=261388 RepID=UPI0003896872|nr:PadR family transcriptional regulator [Ferroplasma sp. Type II]EQB73019.1 MAG: transcriptional regulator [Ferroplasma sp. Type II]
MKYHLSDMLILEQVSGEPKKPYRIIKGIIAKFEMDYKPSTGMIYPAIDRMIKAGYIIKTPEGYIITEEGKKYRSKNRENYEMMISNFLDNKLFFKNLRKAVRELIMTIKEADKDYIREKQDIIIEEIGRISRKIKNKE